MKDHPQRRVGSSEASPRKKYEEFARENERWHRCVEEALDELDELARELDADAARSRDNREAR
jgi:heme oxygenase